MTHSRRDFLRITAAGLPVVVGMLSFFTSAVKARAEVDGGYTQSQADRIHNRSTEEAIKQAGETPEEVRARVDRRLRELRADSTD